MGWFKRRARHGGAVAERGVPASVEGLMEEVRRLTESNHAKRDEAVERRVLQLRHLAGLRLLEAAEEPAPAAADAAALPAADGLPEFGPADLTAGLVRGGILRDGCVLVRGLVPRDDALALAAEIDRAFAERSAAAAGRSSGGGYYEEFEPEPPFEVGPVRPWIEQGGGVLAADSPKVALEVFDVLDRSGLPALVRDYLGEAPLQSVHKTTLRKADPSVGGSWHQDGAFMGGARALNLWLSLSRCGDEAPGLDLVPRRLDDIVIEHDAMLDVEHTRARAREAAGDTPIVRPIFEPGDALLFDEMFLHQTGTDPSMRKPRFALESWFFGGSAFPPDYAPIAV